MPVVSITNGSRRPVVHKVFLGSRNVNNVSDRIPLRLRERVMQSYNRPSSLEGSSIPPIYFASNYGKLHLLINQRVIG